MHHVHSLGFFLLTSCLPLTGLKTLLSCSKQSIISYKSSPKCKINKYIHAHNVGTKHTEITEDRNCKCSLQLILVLNEKPRGNKIQVVQLEPVDNLRLNPVFLTSWSRWGKITRIWLCYKILAPKEPTHLQSSSKKYAVPVKFSFQSTVGVRALQVL